MSKKKVLKTKKKVVVSNKKAKATPTVSRSRSNTASIRKQELIFGKQNYMFMGIGVGLIILGMILMSGGGMDDPNQWDPNVIYSTRRTLIAPILILAGLIMQIYAIFLRNNKVA